MREIHQSLGFRIHIQMHVTLHGMRRELFVWKGYVVPINIETCHGSFSMSALVEVRYNQKIC